MLKVIFGLCFIVSIQVSAGQLCQHLFDSLKQVSEAKKLIPNYPQKKQIENEVNILLSSLSPYKLEFLTDGAKFIKLKKPDSSMKNLNEIEIVSCSKNESGTDKRSSLSLFKGDLYFSHYYYTKHTINYFGPEGVRRQRIRMPISKFAQTQPWLKWNYETQKYTLEKSGSAENIINSVYTNTDMVKLYRGTHKSELDFMNELSRLTDVEATIVSEKKMKRQAFTGYFFSPDSKAAVKWSKDAIVSIEIPKSRMLQWAKEGRIYAGTEGDYFEFSFFDPSIIKTIAQTYKLEAIKPRERYPLHLDE